MHFHLITIFPDMCRAYTDASMLGRAQKNKKIKVSYYDPRTFTKDKHRRVDDKPYGGGPGMVMQAEPILRAAKKAIGKKKKVKALVMSPRGKTFDNAYAKKLARNYKDVVLISGRYEGVDARVKKILKAEEVSVGDYVLTGGELPALTIIDATARQIPGVLGKGASLEDTRTASGELYTRPPVLKWPAGAKGKNYKVPNVLTSGNHADIEAWRKAKDKRD